MKFWEKYKPYIITTAVVLGLAFLSNILSGGTDAYAYANKPPLSPPPIVFPIVWTVLYTLMSIAAVIVAKSNDLDKDKALRLFIIQLGINYIWPIIFFGFSAPKIALVWLLLLIVAVLLTTRVFFSVSPVAGWLMVPYILWLFVAFYLNFGIVALNS
ncbi:MAG: tryptophan-rich sensory protein [Ruminococcaceae bacterium]|nr:tryptophan-rich sensory protein [Oscillospiraceae bacterium]